MVVSDRYHRQRLVSGIGDNGQVAIAQSTIAIVGVGALGCMSASMLARAGVGHVILIDRDIVETTNLQRQILFTEEDARVQRPKAIAAAKHLANVNSDITITAHVEDVTPHNIDRLLQNVDVIVDGLDNFETRYLLNDYAVQTNTPYMFAGAIAGHGNVMAVIPNETPCLRCIFPDPPPSAEQETCDSAGILAPAIGIATSCQTMDVLKFLTGNKDKISCTLLTYDLWNTESNRLALGKPNPECKCCGENEFEYLQKNPIEPMVLCGQLAVQLPSIEQFDINAVTATLQEHGSFTQTASLVKGELNEERSENGSPIKMLCFHDGRTIIHGTNDVGRAKAIFQRYVGN